MKIAVVGLGKLGAVLAAVYAEAGHSVVGFDIAEQRVRQVNAGIAPVSEPHLQNLMDVSRTRLTATTDLSIALRESEATYVLVPTPSSADGSFSNAFLTDALHSIGQELKGRSSRHTVVICSTVMPGSCNGELRNVLEAASERRVGTDLGLVYSPEFIALGSIVHDMRYPDMVLIGESDPESGDLVERNAQSVTHNAPKIHRMNFVNAEITKIAVNTYVTTKISFANMLSEFCDALPQADVDTVTSALGSDTRIGSRYLKGALGYGGPCFPRDNIALSALGNALGVQATIAGATDVVNRRQVSRIVGLLCEKIEPPAVVGVLGLAYKPLTSVCEESQGLEIARVIAQIGYQVVAHDPMVNSVDIEVASGEFHLVQDFRDVIERADVILVTTPCHEYTTIDPERIGSKLLVDAWGIFDPARNVIRPGRSSGAR